MTREIGRPIELVLVAPAIERLLGGQEVQGDQLARAWAHDGEVRVRLLPSNPFLPRGLRWCEHVPALRTVLRTPILIGRIRRALRGADVVHVFAGAHSSFLLGSVPAIGIAMLRRIPVIVHYHSARGDEHLAASPLTRGVLRRCRAVVVPSSYLQRSFARHGVPSLVIPNVVDDKRFPFRAGGVRGNTLLSVRNFEKRYAVDDVIRAYALVKREAADAKLVLAGSGPEEAALRALVRALALPDVTFAGPASREDIGRLMAAAAVMVNTSRIDNMPVSILEAFAAGVPVVTTCAGGIPTFARHDETALLAAPGDVGALAAHVLTILRTPSVAARLVRAARAEADGCMWEAVRPAWLSLYRRMVECRFSSDV